jgi:hypothetical protein
VLVAHSTGFALQTPPQLKDVCQAVIVMNDRLRRRIEQLAWHPSVVRLRQPIDLHRFCFRALNLEQRRPPRVLWLNNYGANTRQRMVERACQTVGIELRNVGQTATPTATPEHEIAKAEIVISLGRGVLEAMASGRAAYVFGAVGGDGWVTANSYQQLERDGFSGRAFASAIDLERLVSDLSSWSEEMGEVGRDLAYRYHDAGEHAADVIELIEQLDAPNAPPPSAAGEFARLLRLEWDREGQARSAASETARLRADAGVLRDQAAATEAKATELERALAELRATRRYRVACRIARPIDRLRARRKQARPG